MKLRNKQTGEIGYLHSDSNNQIQVARNTGYNYKYYDTLAELVEEWEDVPEPKALGWRIDEYNDPEEIGFGFSLEELEYLKEIGLWFETEEETRRAVEKLKAFKRLRDKGFKFDGYDVAHKSNGNLAGQIFYDAGNYSIAGVEKEMDLLFGGEE